MLAMILFPMLLSIAFTGCGIEAATSASVVASISTHTPTATSAAGAETSPAPLYLNETIPPCTLVTKPGVDPCEFRPHASIYSIDRGFPFSADLDLRHRHLIDEAENYYDRTYIPSAHIVLRGTGMPDTVRCEENNYYDHDLIVRTDDQKLEKPVAGKKGAIYCYIDFAVQEYIIGKGPPSVTLLAYFIGRFNSYSDYERFIRPQLEREYAGREYVLYVAPSPYYAVQTLDIVGTWDVQRNPSSYYSSDEYKENHGLEWRFQFTRYAFGAHNPDGYVGEQLYAHMICSGTLCAVGTLATEVIELSEFIQSTKEHHKRLVKKYDGRVRPEPIYADLISDVYDLKLFLEQVGAYNIDGFTPAQPPPIPGENDPYTPGTNVGDPPPGDATVTVPGGLDDTATDTPTPTPTATMPPAPLPADTPTPMPTTTSTAVPTATSPTQAPLPTDTPTPMPTSTPAPLPTDTPTTVPTDTPRDTPTSIPTQAPIPTDTPTPMPTATSTPAPLPTDTPTAVPDAAPIAAADMQSYSCFYPFAGSCKGCYSGHNCNYQQQPNR